MVRPRSVAVVGASSQPTSVGGSLLLRLRAELPGSVYAVNPNRTTVRGFGNGSPQALPESADLAVVPDVVRECGATGIRGAVIVSAGFREIGEEGLRLDGRAAAEEQRFDACASSGRTALSCRGCP